MEEMVAEVETAGEAVAGSMEVVAKVMMMVVIEVANVVARVVVRVSAKEVGWVAVTVASRARETAVGRDVVKAVASTVGGMVVERAVAVRVWEAMVAMVQAVMVVANRVEATMVAAERVEAVMVVGGVVAARAVVRAEAVKVATTEVVALVVG